MEGMAPVEARRRGKVGLIFQQPVLFPWRTVRENIELPGEIRSESYLKEGVQEMLRITQLEGYESYYPHQLSGGMQSRVAIARALVTQPDLLLLDEPFADLDEINRERMNLELQRIWMRSKATMVFVTHDLGEAAFLGDRVLVLSPRPARLVADIAVPFPRPRGPELLDSREFDEILAEIRRALRQPMSMASVEAEPAGQ